MKDLEIPLGKRSLKYRFFEMVPALVSIGAVLLVIILSLTSPVLAAIYLLLVVTTVLTKAIFIAFHMITGRKHIKAAENMNWKAMLDDLETSSQEYTLRPISASEWTQKQATVHAENIARIASNPEDFPRPSELYNAVIVATYNEPYEVLKETIESVRNTTYDNKHIMLVLAYEARGGKATKATAKKLKQDFSDVFFSFDTVEHPSDMPNEVVGKGGNITYAGKWLQRKVHQQGIAYNKIIITTLDSDNRPHKTYFDYVTYEYIVHDNRKQLSYQPVSLFLNNIWDVPAPMRVVATGNSFWNIISAMRPHALRNFASHSQPMDALVEMEFWSTRTIVEDGHQYWRSFFHFNGQYDVLPIFVPIYQDAVLSDTYVKTLKAQFVQLRRWAYGASDVPYVAVRVFSKDRRVEFWAGFSRFIRLLDGHVTLACIPILVTFGGWIPRLINPDAAYSVAANQLPEVLGLVQRVALIGLFITIFLSIRMLPPRPERYKRRRTIGMVLQWVLMPVTALAYSSTSAYYSQIRLLTGRYLDVFDVTEKASIQTIEKAKEVKAQKK